MTIRIHVLFAALIMGFSGNLHSQTYNESSDFICQAYTSKQYTFLDTPETPVTVDMTVQWMYCGPWSGSNSGHIYLSIWIDGGWVYALNTTHSGNGCGWTYTDFTISATMWNDAINSNGGSVLFSCYITDSCPGGVGCSGWSDPCFKLTASYDYAPSANFSVSSTEICPGGEVTFYNETTGPQNTFDWNFGEGATPATATGMGPHVVSWNTSGLKEISLTVVGNGDESTEIKTDYIDVGDAPESIIFGEAFESWQSSKYKESIATSKIVKSNSGGYYCLGTFSDTNSTIWIRHIAEDGSELWYSQLAGANNDVVNDAYVSDDGSLFVCGQRGSDYLVAKINSAGGTDWSYTYNDNGTDVANAITLDPEGDIYVTGSTNNAYDATTVKLDGNGVFIYEVTVAGGAAANQGTGILAESDYFYMMSWGRTTGINADMHLSKYESTLGILQWTQNFNGTGFATDEAHEMEVFGDYIYLMGLSDQGADNGWTVVQMGKDGSSGWSTNWFMGEDTWTASDRFEMDADGNLYLASTQGDGVDQSVKLYKISGANGSELWQHEFDAINETWLEGIDIAPNGNVFILARTKNNSGGWDLAVAEVDQVPSQPWWAVYNGCGSSDDWASDVVATSNNEVIIAGYNSQAVAVRYGALVEPVANFQITTTPLCTNSPIVFEDLSTGSGLSYSWAFGAGASPTTATGPGPHQVVYSTSGTKTASLSLVNSLGTSSTSFQFTMNASPTLTVIPNQSICSGSQVEISATSNGTVIWDNGLGAGNAFTVNPTSTTTYNATVENLSGCVSSGSVTVEVNPTPTVNAGNNFTLCQGSAFTFNGSGTGTLTWNNGAGTGPNPTITATVTTTYTLTATLGGCTATDDMLLTVLPAPNVSGGSNVSICQGQSANLTAQGASTYTWYPMFVTQQQITVSPTQTTTYTVVGTGANGCTAQATVTVTVNALPAANAGADASICSGQSYSLVASGGSSYLWVGVGPGSTQVVTPATTTTYTVNVTNSFGCVASDAVQITVLPTPEALAGDDQIICIGDNATLAGDGGVGYNWVGYAEEQVIVVSPATTTSYTLIVEAANGCTDEDMVMVTVMPLPTVNAGADVAICSGQSTTLNAVGGIMFTWDNGLGEGQSQVVSPLTTTTYSVIVEDINGCENSDAVVVTVNSLPAANAGADQTICPGESATLSASGGVEYSWDNGAGETATVEVSPQTTTTYTVTAIDDNGCEGTDQVMIIVHPVVALTISGLGTDPYCVENDLAVSLTGNPSGGDFSGPGVSGNEFVPANAGVGVHTITYTYEDGNGCTHETTAEASVEICDFVVEWESWIEVFPVPTQGALTVMWKGAVAMNLTSVKLIDASGRLVPIQPVSQSDRLTFDLSGLASGNYTLILQQDDKLWKRGVVLER
jgi:hypothetical protein